MNNYKIYLVNAGAKAKNFWCFLDKPKGVQTSSVYANSDTMLNVLPNYNGENSFTIPLQYVVGAGAKNQAVGLDIKINSTIKRDVQLQDTCLASYATTPPKQAPLLDSMQDQESPENTIRLDTNKYNEVINQDDQWYSNMSFGIQTEEGFTGTTWEPSPNNQYTITPKFKFFIATGNYTSNTLANIDDVSRSSAAVSLTDFKNLEATVTLNSDGSWTVTPGAPPPPSPPYS